MVELLSKQSSENYDWGLPEDDDEARRAYLPDMGRLDSVMEEPKLTRGQSFELFEEKEIEPRQRRMIERVIEYLKVSECVARALLIRYMWDVDRLIRESIENEHIVRQLLNIDFEQTRSISQGQNPILLCPVCYCESTHFLGMECGHQLCFECYKEYLLC